MEFIPSDPQLEEFIAGVLLENRLIRSEISTNNYSVLWYSISDDISSFIPSDNPFLKHDYTDFVSLIIHSPTCLEIFDFFGNDRVEALLLYDTLVDNPLDVIESYD